MNLRDEVETVLRAWDAHEIGRGRPGIIDYDCHPVERPVSPAPDRLWVLARLTELHGGARREGKRPVEDRVRADLAYLRSILGERPPIRRYLRDTQGCDPVGWSDEELAYRRELAVAALQAVDVTWGPDLNAQLRAVEGPLSACDAADAVRQATRELESRVRALTGTTATYTLSVESVDIDAYWAYWLDGAGLRARLRLNLRQARFTQARARQIAMHEVLGHALQCASYADRAAADEVPWVRLMSVHTPYQMLLEGLAQVMPLLITPEDPIQVARVRLAHYSQLVLARMHLASNGGVPAARIAEETRALVPHWRDTDIADAMGDRGTDPLLRSYLWSYPVGIDWFVDLVDHASPQAIGTLLRRAYRQPLTPEELTGP